MINSKKNRYTNRGFRRDEFFDIYGDKCSIQESSLATKEALWLGMVEGKHVDGHCLSRMHVDKKLARWLIKKLQRFVDRGNI
ncbi:MAG: hypothetical protein V3U54_08605 [Thermodesulfobacteriota bacterium]